MHDIQEYECANTLLVKAVRKHLKTNSANPDERPSDDEVEQALTTAVVDAGLSLSVMAKGFIRRGMNSGDFPLLCATWANHAGYSGVRHPTLQETAEHTRPADAVWQHLELLGIQTP